MPHHPVLTTVPLCGGGCEAPCRSGRGPPGGTTTADCICGGVSWGSMLVSVIREVTLGWVPVLVELKNYLCWISGQWLLYAEFPACSQCPVLSDRSAS